MAIATEIHPRRITGAAQRLETGKPLAEARHEVEYARDFAYWYGEEARRVAGYTLPSATRANSGSIGSIEAIVAIFAAFCAAV